MNLRSLIPWLFFLLFISTRIYAQECGCFNCNLPVPANSRDTFEFVFDELLNDNLAHPTQGICGVEIRFIHNRVRSLEMWLVSPSGQIIQLMGPNLPNPTIQTTVSAIWDILFVRSIDPAAPDPGIPATWSNNSNWVNSGNYRGSYYPYLGNLEDFNSGPVNGTWKLVVQNHNLVPFYDGIIYDFRVIFCDPTGIVCCFANGGNTTGQQTFRYCTNDNSLLFDLPVNFNNNRPDTTEYDYTWIIARDSVILDYDTLPDLRSYPSATYELCGLSYKQVDFDSIPNPDGILRWDTLRNRLEQVEPPFCADISTRCYKIIITDPPANITVFDTICIGETYSIGDSIFTETGSYPVFFQLASGCDSIVDLNLEVLIPDTTFLRVEICHQDSFQMGGVYYNQSGVYVTSIPSVGYCDSLVKLDLSVLQPIDTSFTAAVCAGDSLLIGNTVLDQPGYYEVLLSSRIGCDSLVKVTLQVVELAIHFQMPDTLTCSAPVVSIDAGNSSPGGLDYFWSTAIGQINSPLDLPSILVSRSGWYSLNINIDTFDIFCTITDSIFVEHDQVSPTAVLEIPDTIQCDQSEVVIYGDNSSQGVVFQYFWRKLGTGIIAGALSDTILIDTPGTYELVVSNSQNGCRDSAFVTVLIDTIRPVAEAGTGFEINCQISADTLDGSASSFGSGYVYAWNGPGILCCGNTSRPVVDRLGVYHLEVLNTANGCISNDSVVVTQDISLPVASAGLSDTLDCAQPQLTLSGTGSAGLEFSTSWSTPDGRILADTTTFQPLIDLPGTYYLTVTNTNNFCVRTDSVQIFQNFETPVADAGIDREITCRDSVLLLGGTGSSNGAGLSVRWLIDGAIIPGATGTQIPTNSPGTYVLEITDLKNHCADSDTVTVTLNNDYPDAEAGNGFTLNCQIDADTLSGIGSSTGAGIQYLWQTMTGCIQSPVTDLQIEVGCPGVYYLSVINSLNACEAIDSVVVTEDVLYPVVNAGMPDTLNCQKTILTLNGNGPVGPEYSIMWTTSDGHIYSGSDSYAPSVDSAGTYVLTVFNSVNFCASKDSVNIEVDVDYPIALAGNDTILTCRDTVVELGADSTSGGPEFLYEWSENGILLGTNSKLIVTEPGIYSLTVSNNRNQCVATDTVQVTEDKTAPIADAGTGFQLNCTVLSDTLSGLNSSIGNAFSYRWQSMTNCFSGDPNRIEVVVNCPEWFFLTVTNDVNGCRSTDSVLVTEDANLPLVSAGNPDTLTCSTTEVVLNGSSTPTFPDVSIFWNSPDGNIVSGDTTYRPTVNEPGTYILTVIRRDNQCARQASVIVREFLNIPVADAGLDQEINCDTVIVTIGGPNTSTGSNFTYQWLDQNHVPIPGANNRNFITFQPGIFVLYVLDNQSLCEKWDTVEVMRNLSFPIADAGDTLTLNCSSPVDTLDGSRSSQGLEFHYRWTTRDGTILSSPDSIRILVSAPGVYYLSVLNIDNQCFSQDSVIVNRDVNLPLATATDTVQLLCPDRQAFLDGSGSSLGPNIIYRWSSAAGNILTGQNTLQPLVDFPGTYQLEVRDTANDCSAFVQVIVLDTINPVARAGGNTTLDCFDLENGKILDGSGSSLGSQFQYFWTTSGGNFLSRSDTITPVIDAAGLYNLLVINTETNCDDEDDIFVSLSTEIPTADPGNSFDVPCDTAQTTIDGSRSTAGPAIEYQWTTQSGRILGAANANLITVDTTGFYVLKVTNTNSGCSSIDSVFINFLPCGPAIFISLPDTINCLFDRVRLDASASGLNNAQINWTALEGTILSGNQTPMPWVSAGLFRLVLRDTTTSLISTADVRVFADTIRPSAIVNDSFLITCLDTMVMLDGTRSTGNHPLNYFWESILPLSDNTSPQPVTRFGGSYNLIVTDAKNGCKDTASTTVYYDTIAPIAHAGADQFYPCDTAFIRLDGSRSEAGPDIEYLWNTGDQVLSPAINTSGTFCLTVTNTRTGCKSSDCVEVKPDQNAPVIAAFADGTITCADTIVTIFSQTPPGNLAISWTTTDGCILGNSISDAVQVNCPGTYTLQVRDLNNRCVSVYDLTVDINVVKPIAEAGSKKVLSCKRKQIELDGTASSIGNQYRYQWTGTALLSGDQTLQPTVFADGWYFLEITDTVNGCRSFDSVQVFTDNQMPLADAGADVTLTCKVQQIQLNGRALSSEGTPGIQWFSSSGTGIVLGANSLNPLIDQAGTYILEVQDTFNGCLSADTVAVLLDTIVPDRRISRNGTPILNCLVDSVLLVALGVRPANDFVFRWSTNTGNILTNTFDTLALVDQSGWYILTVEGIANGCLAKDSIFVNEDYTTIPITTLPINPLTCSRFSTSVAITIPSSISDVRVHWSTTDGKIITHPDSLEIGVEIATRYTVEVQNLNNGCISMASVNVPIDTIHPFAMAIVQDSIDCFHTLARLNGSGSSQTGRPYLYNWSTQSGGTIQDPGTLFPMVDTPGWYTLTVLDSSNGCADQDSVLVVENASAIRDVWITISPEQCYGDANAEIRIDSVAGGTRPFSYSIDETYFSIFNVFNNLSAGRYPVTIEDAAGCVFDTAVIIEDKDQVTINLGPDHTIRLGDSAEITALTNIGLDQMASLTWKPDTWTACKDCFDQKVSPPISTVYTAILRDTNGCIASDQVSITVITQRPVYIPSAFSPNGDGNNERFMIFADVGIVKIDRFLVFDRWGDNLFEAQSFQPNDPNYGWDGRYKGRLMNPGVYVYMAEITFVDGKTEIFSGEFTLYH